jgi:hypothetical protein
MRIRGGIVLRSSDIIKLPKAATAVTEMAITTAGLSCAVTASAEQTPKTCTKMGLSLLSGPKYFLIFIVFIFYLLSFIFLSFYLFIFLSFYPHFLFLFLSFRPSSKP